MLRTGKNIPKTSNRLRLSFSKSTDQYVAACEYVNQHFNENPGQLSDAPLYPDTFEAAEAWFEQFLQQRFEEFGDYEDAIVAEASILNHSLLSPLINVGLLEPQDVIEGIMAFAEAHETRINSVEGLIRQNHWLA